MTSIKWGFWLTMRNYSIVNVNCKVIIILMILIYNINNSYISLAKVDII